MALPAYKASAELRKTAAVIGAVVASSLHKLREDLRERPWAADGERLRECALGLCATATFHYRKLRAQFRQYPWGADAARLREMAERLCRLALYRLRRSSNRNSPSSSR